MHKINILSNYQASLRRGLKKEAERRWKASEHNRNQTGKMQLCAFMQFYAIMQVVPEECGEAGMDIR